jgi:hypothetical protein
VIELLLHGSENIETPRPHDQHFLIERNNAFEFVGVSPFIQQDGLASIILLATPIVLLVEVSEHELNWISVWDEKSISVGKRLE